MALVPPRFIPPLSMQNATEWTIWIDDGLSSGQYGTSTYETEEEAQTVCEALQEVYTHLLYDCTFTPQAQAKPTEDPFALDMRLLGK